MPGGDLFWLSREWGGYSLPREREQVPALGAPRVGSSHSSSRLAGRPGQQGPGGRGLGSRHPLPGGSASLVASPRPPRFLARGAPRAVTSEAPAGRSSREPAGGQSASGLGLGSAQLRCRPRLLPGLGAALRAPPPPAAAAAASRRGLRRSAEPRSPRVAGPRSHGTGGASVHANRRANLSLCCGLRLRQVFSVFSKTHLMAPLFLFQTACKGLWSRA